MPLLDVQNLRIGFRSPDGARVAVESLSFSLESGEVLCLVGESGSGKSVTALAIGRLLPAQGQASISGKIWLDGRDVIKMDAAELRSIRGRVVSYVFQEPGVSLNPVLRVGDQILEMLELHQSRQANRSRVVDLLSQVGISSPEIRAREYPHRLSGGMQQRVMIAMAVASNPKLLVIDEPTTALDVTIQAQILHLLNNLKQRKGMAMLMITHNLGIVQGLADRIAVMYAGEIVEEGPARDVLARPGHPYSKGLIASVPKLGDRQETLATIPGAAPIDGRFPEGCRFHPRCSYARDSCRSERPKLVEIASGRRVRCPFWKEVL